jgi:RNA polymerase sigma-70 factor (ECF subfamily)
MSYVANQYVTNKEDVADIVHDSMIKIIYNIDKIDIEDELRARSFCTTVAKHKAIDFLRKKEQYNVPLDEKFDNRDSSEDVLDIVINEESYGIILKAIDNLSDTYQSVCKLKYINGLKEREIAEVLDLPAKTVNLRIFRGKQILREALIKEQLHG